MTAIVLLPLYQSYGERRLELPAGVCPQDKRPTNSSALCHYYVISPYLEEMRIISAAGQTQKAAE